MTKKTYIAPALKVIDITGTEILAGSGNINTGGSPADYYDIIPGYDNSQGGWGTGTPD